MPRVKRAVGAHKKRKKALKATKGFKWGRKNKYKLAKDALRHAWAYAYRDRRKKKAEFRQLWQIQINAACRDLGLNYSRFIKALKDNKVEIDRKMLATIAQKHPDTFTKIIDLVKK